MIRKIAAVVLGVVLAFVLIIAVESLGHSVYPPPADLDFTDQAAMRAYVDTLPLGALLFVMAAWLAGTFGGGLLAILVAGESPFVNAAIIGGLVLLGTVINLVSIPHPTWFSITSVVAIVATALLTSRIGAAFVGRGKHADAGSGQN